MRRLLLAAAGVAVAVAIAGWFLSRAHERQLNPARPAEPADEPPAGANAELEDLADAVAARSPVEGELATQARSQPPEALGIAAVLQGHGRTHATVLATDQSGERVLGVTSADRLLAVSVAELSFPLRLTATSDGPLIGSRVLEELPAPAIVEIELTEGCSLQGSVVDRQGRPIAAGIKVIALDPARRLSWLAEVLAGETPALDGRWASGETDLAGGFRLTGLLPGGSYGLYAAGAGFATSDELDMRRFACGEEAIVLTASPLFAGIVRVGSQRTDELVRQASTVAFGVVRVGQFPKTSVPLDLGRSPAVAGTTAGAEARAAEAEGRRVVAFIGPEELEELPMRAQVRVPFLAPDWHEIAVPRLHDTLADIPIDVADPEQALGTLTVQALVPAGLSERLDPDEELGKLKLKRDGLTHEYVIKHGPLRSGLDIPALPAGVYEWSLCFPNGAKLLPRKGEPSDLDLAPAGSTLLLDLTWSAALDLTVRDRDGVPISGPLHAELTTLGFTHDLDAAGRAKIVSYNPVAEAAWTKPPYVMPFVPPGEGYYIACNSDFGLRIHISFTGPFALQARTVTPVELSASK